MASVKLCTDLNQSKILKEILPLESADMVLLHEEPYETSDSMFDGLHQVLCVPFKKYDKQWREKYKNISYFPCWSLAALLNVMRIFTTPTAFSVNVSTPSLIKTKNGYKLTYIGDYTPMINNGLDVEAPIESTAENAIDCCVMMILKLHELNLL